MLHMSSNRIKLLTIIILTLSFQYLGATEWPVNRKIDLSSGFGDFRANRFHTGVDIRTGGKVGTQILAPVSGYIYRVRTAYSGYGKGLYLKGDDGFIYVFGHLLDFEPKIDAFVKAKQRETRRYSLDTTFVNEQFRVKKNDFLGYSGQTGAGAPHLHFEKRTADNLPLNPLTNGFSLDDTFKPIFSKIGFKMLDDVSLFDNGLRELEFSPLYDTISNNYILDTLIYFNRPFGLFAGVYDQMRTGGMKQSVYKLTLKVDAKEFYAVTFEELDFDAQRAVNFRYDYLKAVNKEKRIQLLYNNQGNDFQGSVSKNKSNGKIGFNQNISYGHHTGEIIAEDCFGNKQSLKFDFIYGPEEELYHLDSHVVELRKDHYYYFTPSINLEAMQIDSVVPFINRGQFWGLSKAAVIEKLENGQFRCKMSGHKTSTTTIRLFLFSKKAVIRDNIFNGVMKKGKKSVTLDYVILEDGILVNLAVRAKQSADARIELYYKNELLDVFYPELFNMEMYRCIIPPLEKYEHIDKIGFAMSKDTTFPLKFRDSLHINLVGHKNNQKISYHSITFEFEKNNFYAPRFIEFKKRFFLKDSNERMVSSLIDINPTAFLCKSNFKMSYTVRKSDPFYERAGFGWFDKNNTSWVWLDNKREGHSITAESTGGGTIAVLYDLSPPVMSRLSIINGRTYKSRNVKVAFIIDDLLSGFEDDRSFKVKLSKEWLIPEYDPESKQFITRPAKPLEPGKHHLGIEVIDRVGNKFEQYLNFFVKKDNNRR